MRVVIQCVSEASVSIEGQIYSEIQQGLLVLLGIEHSDAEQDIEWLSKKIANLRIFVDDNNQINKSIIDINKLFTSGFLSAFWFSDKPIN